MKTMVGSPYFVAPEVLFNNYNEKCDCWSVGVLMYYLLSSIMPFNGETLEQLYSNIFMGLFRLLGHRWARISTKAKDLISKLLVVDPNKRYSSAEALAHPWFTDELDIPGPNEEIVKTLQSYKSETMLKGQFRNVMINFLNKKELKDVIETFKFFDKGNDGYITIEEFQSALKVMGQDLTKEEIRVIMKEINLDNQSDHINYSNFVAATMKKESYLDQERLKTVFKHFDTHDRNRITAKDLCEGMARIGRKLEQEEADNMIKEVKKQGELSFDDFVALMSNERGKIRKNSLQNIDQAQE
jgi:calcium-dependent protein kinase